MAIATRSPRSRARATSPVLTDPLAADNITTVTSAAGICRARVSALRPHAASGIQPHPRRGLPLPCFGEKELLESCDQDISAVLIRYACGQSSDYPLCRAANAHVHMSPDSFLSGELLFLFSGAGAARNALAPRHAHMPHCGDSAAPRAAGDARAPAGLSARSR